MTKEEGKGKKRKQRVGNQAGNRPSTEEEESSKQLVEEKEENMQTGTANEAGHKQRLARRRKQLSYGGMKIKKEKEINRDRDDRAKKKLEHETYKAFCGLPGITDMFKRFSEEYMRKINVESLEGMAEQEPELTENFKRLDEYFMSKFIRKWQELFRTFFEEEGTTDNFKAIYLKVKEEEERQERDKIIELLENRGMLEGKLKAGPSNIDLNSEGEWQSSTTTPMIGGVTNSSSTGGHVGIGPILGTPSEERPELRRKREEELHQACRGKGPATADNYTPPRPPICVSQPSGFMADTRHQTSPESATADLFLANKGLEARRAAHGNEASNSAWAAPWE